MSLSLQTNNLHIMKFLSILLFSLGALSINAQSIDEELGFIYVKADYLLETDRYEDAIKEFTKIIAKDPSYKDALYKRGKAKYAIAAFKGTRNDLLQSFELVGITPEALTLFGNTLKNLDQHDAATITLNTASMINSGGSKSSDGPSRQSKDKNSDTDSDEKGEIEKLEDKLSSILDDLLPDRKTDGEDKSDDSTTTTGGDAKNSDTGRDPSDSNTDSGTTKSEKIEVKVEEKEEDKPDTSINKIFIDEDLTIQIKNGLGSRKILDQPNILILSDKSGEVSVDVCVDANGKVTSAEYNKNSSSISTQSLVSLAVRKSKEFWFKKSDSKKTCGSMVFIITGGA